MTGRQTIHIVDRDARQRAGLAHQLFSLGHHAEVYETLAELLSRPPSSGLVLARDDQARSNGIRGAASILAQMAEVGVWLPLVATSLERDVDAVRAAMKAGALDFFLLPLTTGQLEEALGSVEVEAERATERQRRIVEARDALGRLSKRENEVLKFLAEGFSNKEIARELEISPRTVEIHRANMMLKLSARHPSDAVRTRFEARLDNDGADGAALFRRGRRTPPGPSPAH